MTIQIYWGEDFTKHRGYTMFDIEYYQVKVENKNVSDGAIPSTRYHLWQSELHVLPCVEGLVRYTVAQKDNPNFNIEDFIRDSEEIQELRGWLWEHNQPSEDSKLHYGGRYEYIRNKVDDYAKKYDVYVNID